MSVGCSLCDRKSLLIYPVRYAVASPRGAAKAPALTGNFKMDGRAPQSVATAKYTLRALRAGYLYTYDERRRRLRAYMVLPDGLMWSFVPGQHPPPESSVRNTATGCARRGDMAFLSLGRCVDVEHTPGVDEATNLWIGWSNVAWTKTLVEKALGAEGAKWRALHMQCIDVKAMIGGGAAHTGEFQSSRAHIAPFAMDSQALKDAFDFGNTPTEEERRLRDLADRIGGAMAQTPFKKGFVVAVNDPVGITNDLAELTTLIPAAGFDMDMQRGHIIHGLLKQAEINVRNSAADGVVMDDEEEALSKDDIVNGGDPVLAGKKLWRMFRTSGGPTAYAKQQAEDAKKYGTSQEARQKAASDHAWFAATHDDDGKPTLNMDRFNQFPAKYDAAVKAYQPKLEQLTAAHASWLSCKLLADWLTGVNDPENLSSGFAYSESVAQCISKAVATPDCMKRLNAWLDDGNATDTGALYVRALLFNQDDFARAIGRKVKPSDIQLEQLLNLYKNAVKRQDAKEAATLLDRLSITTANILVDALTSTGRSTARFLAAVRLTFQSGHALKVQAISAQDLRDFIVGQVKEEDVKLTTNRTQTRKDAHAAGKKVMKAVSHDSTIYATTVDVEKIAQDGMITADSVKVVHIPLVQTTKKWLGSSVPKEFHLGVATAIIQMAALKFTFDDFRNSDQTSVAEAGTKFLAAGLSLGGTITEALCETVQKSATHPLSAYILKQWPNMAESAEKWAAKGRILGAAGGIVAAFYDLVFNMPAAFKNKDYYLAGLYFASGGIGAYIAIASALLPEVPLFWPAVIAALAIGIFIAIRNSNALHNWIAGCYFGVSESYSDLRGELYAYDKAVGA